MEDTYSNLLGARVAAAVLTEDGADFDKAFAEAFDRELDELGVQSAGVAKAACESVREKWFSGDMLFMVDMRMRHLDIGIDDGYVTPLLVPGVGECDGSEPQSYPAPDLAFMQSKGFVVKVEIQPREWERGRVLKAANPNGGRKNRIDPVTDFGPLMAYIEKDAIRRGYSVYPQQAGLASRTAADADAMSIGWKLGDEPYRVENTAPVSDSSPRENAGMMLQYTPLP